VGEEFVAFLLPGNRVLNEVKIKKLFGEARTATAQEVKSVCGVEPGFAGPLGISIKKVADIAVKGKKNWVVGANKEEHHLMNACIGRDFHVDEFEDIKVAEEGDPCPICGDSMQMGRGIEVAHVFLLGTKYSEPMRAFCKMKEGEEVAIVMGCYGIGISRIISAVVEQCLDGSTLLLPSSIAPYDVHILLLSPQQREMADSLYKRMKEEGLDVLYDERDIGAGKKFFDAELLGIPRKVIVGKHANEGKVELRRGKGVEFLEIETLLQQPKDLL
jgi:prolyl-tRNA synthetase